jgi:hypothetical protein
VCHGQQNFLVRLADTIAKILHCSSLFGYCC